jgi:dTDP-4-dehydrorhamnose reductase
MKILILGGDGMLGHQVQRHAIENGHEVAVTLRQPLQVYAEFGLFDAENSFDNIDVRSIERLCDVFASFRPQAVVNCVGIVKQRPFAQDIGQSLEINALLPHRLATLCGACGAHLVHISTDCVFDGRRGNYKDNDFADATDIYGRTKYLGEVSGEHCITLRSSIIGFELSRKTGLLEWVLAQSGTIKGFRRAIFSGFTTNEMARIILKMLQDHPRASGIYQVSSAPINKFDLVSAIARRLKPDLTVVPDDAVAIDRSLDSSRFRSQFEYTPPSWSTMLDELMAVKPTFSLKRSEP